jgi:integrase
MSYDNPRHEGRLVTVDILKDAFAEITVNYTKTGATQSSVLGANQQLVIYNLPELLVAEVNRHLYHLPYLFHEDGTPWLEANSYLLNSVAVNHSTKRPTDKARRRAAKLLDYLMFCESEGISWLDFSGARPGSRPTYKYYNYLIGDRRRSSAVVNQYTGVVYDFYKYVSANWHKIDLSRVDQISKVSFLVDGHYGSQTLTKEKRSQTQATPPPAPVAIGYVRDEGEDLRPLANLELAELLKSIELSNWSVAERLIIMISLMTGARKQTLLTLRMRHIQLFNDNVPLQSGSYSVFAGPGTGIDTKNNIRQRLYFPKQLADELRVYAASPLAVERREKFKAKYIRDYPDLPTLDSHDVYLFLSDQGGSYYMATDDPRYQTCRSPSKGQVTENLKRKIFSGTSESFPKDFSFHLRFSIISDAFAAD